MNWPQTEAGRALLDDPEDGYPIRDDLAPDAPEHQQLVEWRRTLSDRILAIEQQAVTTFLSSKRTELLLLNWLNVIGYREREFMTNREEAWEILAALAK